MKSPIYWHPEIYHQIMKLLYGKHFEARYQAIADLIPDYASVTEVCAGDGYLFRHYLQKKMVKYIGLDINSSFVTHGQHNNVPIVKHDILTEKIPSSDYVIIHASLYQFIPAHQIVVNKLLEATQSVLLIAEPIKNLASSNNPFISFLAKYSANPGKDHTLHRFNKNTLVDFFQQFKEFSSIKEVKGGREIIGVFKKRSPGV
jgi:Methionine biosynthesis protein MetW